MQLIQDPTRKPCELPVHVTHIWVKIKGVDTRKLFGVYLYRGQYHAYEPKLGYLVPMYKGPLDAKEGDRPVSVGRVVKERVKLGIENKIAERGLDKVKEALQFPIPQLQRLEI